MSARSIHSSSLCHSIKVKRKTDESEKVTMLKINVMFLLGFRNKRDLTCGWDQGITES